LKEVTARLGGGWRRGAKAIDPILADGDEACEWAAALDMPPGWAKGLTLYFRIVEEHLALMPPRDVVAWRAKEVGDFATDPSMQYTEEKLTNFLARGANTPFGRAIANSEVQHCARLKCTIVRFAGWRSQTLE
jgi:hypothetical protein